MALKAWIDDIKTDESGWKSEAQLEQADAPGADVSINLKCADYHLPGELEADKILFVARDEIIKGGVFHYTPETQAAEVAVNQAYKAILSGGSDFDSLRAACARWVLKARTKPAPPVMAELFSKAGSF